MLVLLLRWLLEFQVATAAQRRDRETARVRQWKRSTSEASSDAVSDNVGFAAGDQNGASSPADKPAVHQAEARASGVRTAGKGSVTKSGISGIAGEESFRTGVNSSPRTR